MKISTGGIGIGATTSDAITVGGGGGGDPPAYPSDWAWSANFAQSGVRDAVEGADVYTYAADGGGETWADFDGGVSPIANTTAPGGSGLEVNNDTAAKSPSYWGFEFAGPSELPAAAMSSALTDGVGGIDFTTDRYLTIYFQIFDDPREGAPAGPAAGGDDPEKGGPAGLMEYLWWQPENDPRLEQFWNGGAETGPASVIRKTGGHDRDGVDDITGDPHQDGEFWSVCFDMQGSTNDTGKGAVNWEDSGLAIGQIGVLGGYKWLGGRVIIHGMVLSSKDNSSTNPQIYSPSLPIQVS